MHFAAVALQEATRSYDKLYDYIVPERYRECVQPGMRVIIPFGPSNRLRTAYIINLHSDNNENENIKYKEIHEIVDHEPLLTEEMIKLVLWMKKRYFCTYGDAIRAMLPSGINLKKQVYIRITSSFDDYIRQNNTILNSEQKKLLNKIARKSQGVLKENIVSDEESSDFIKGLFDKGILEEFEQFGQIVTEKTVKAVRPVISKEEFDFLVERGRIRSIYPVRIMDVLYNEEYCTLQDLTLISGVSYSTVRNMVNKGWIEYFDFELERDPFTDLIIERTEKPVLTEEQLTAVNNILPLLEERKLHEVLIHGITGSGKTEIYLNLIEAAVEKGRTSIVLVPEISLTPQMVSRFKGRFGDRIAVQHSRLSHGERYDQWRKIRAGEVDVVIGARSAVFAPLTNIGFIIIDEEHELTYKSENTPRYDARHIARARCNINGAVLVLGSATPSLETYYRAQKGKISLYTLKNRPNYLPLPEVEIVDLREELKAGNRKIISRRLEEELVKNKEKSEQSIIFINRRGYASFLLCQECGYVLKCPNCSITLTVHSYDKLAVCHYCGYSRPIPVICPECESQNIKPFGTGTQKVQEELENHPAGFKILRMDLDTTQGKHGHRKILEAFKNKEADILLGTQMVAKGHDFPEVSLVGILSADSFLFSSDYRASERTFQLITQASGRAGRGSVSGRVILQAYNVDDYAIKAGIAQDYEMFYNAEILMRQKFISPPFCHIGVIIVSGENEGDVKTSINRLKGKILARYKANRGFICSEPLPCPVSMIRNRFRWRIIIKMASLNKMIELMNYTVDIYDKLAVKGTSLTVDIDPASMV